jgi:hypothetical protein
VKVESEIVKYMRLVIHSRNAALAGFVFSLASSACSDAAPAKGDPPSTAGGPSEYRLHVYAVSGEKRERIDFAPIEDTRMPSGTAPARSSSSAVRTAGITPLMTNPVPTGSAPSASSWEFVRAAAAECGMIGDASGSYRTGVGTIPGYATDSRYAGLEQMAKLGRRTLAQAPLVFPWLAEGSWYLFPKAPSTCDEVLEDEETLLCIADKLAETADSIAPVTWENVRWLYQPTVANSDLVYQIPPQAETSKFIARDLAISVLAHMALLDATSFGDPVRGGPEAWPGPSCSAMYAGAEAVGDAATRGRLYERLYGTSSGPAAYPPSETFPPTRARLSFETNTLRAAGLLLHDLIRRSVYSDLAGSAHLSAQSLDAPGGSTSVWGLDGSQPYNSVSHGLRILLGRLEIGNALAPEFKVEGDPRCGGVDELRLATLSDAATQSRTRDRVALTGNEAFAASLFERAGLVVPPAADGQVRPLLQAQVLTALAAERGSDRAAYEQSASGSAIKSVISHLTDADLAAGAARNRATFSVITNRPATQLSDLVGGFLNTGLKPATALDPSVAGVGVVFDNGLSRIHAVGDVIAHAGPMMGGSQCEANGLGPALSFDSDIRGALQGAFEAGAALRTRLVKLREVSDGSAILTRGGPPDVRARGAAVAELGAWAGQIRVAGMLVPKLYNETYSPDQLTLVLDGITAPDVGEKTLDAAARSIAIVLGDAVDAECAAGLRRDQCQAATERAMPYFYGADNGSAPGTASSRRDLGHTGDRISLLFDFNSPSAPSGLRTETDGDRARLKHAIEDENKLFYVIARQDPTQPQGTGMVLGALHFGKEQFLGWDEEGRPITKAFTVSPMRRELLNAVLGVGKWVGTAPPRIGANSLAASPQYCVEGVSRDVFVPLSNELTDDSDQYENSWKHYIAIAREAAKRADDLGQQWIDVGFNRDQRAENTGEALQEATGSYVSTDDISVDENGNLDAGSANGALGAALGMRTVDLVFLTTDPFESLTDDLQKILPCPSASAPGVSVHPLCAKITSATRLEVVDAQHVAHFSGPTAPGNITYSALGLAKFDDPPKFGMDNCGEVIDSAARMKGAPTVFSRTGGVFSSPAFNTGIDNHDWAKDTGQLESAMRFLQMNVDETGHWWVSSGGAKVMDSDDGAFWPACLSAAAGCNWADPNHLQESLNSMFRWCPSGAERSALGACGDGDANTESNALKWRVEAALWLMASMNGGVPRNMFDVAMPAVNFDVSALNSSAECAPITTVYGNGFFGPAPDLNFAGGVGPAIPHENEAVQEDGKRPAVIPARFMVSSPHVASEMPSWLRVVYDVAPPSLGVPACQVGTKYVHVFGSNADGPSDFGNLVPFFSAIGVNGGSTVSVEAATIKAIASRLDGLQCTAPVGDLPFGGQVPRFDPIAGKTGIFQGLVASLKSQRGPDSPMRAPFYRGEQTDWYPWATTYRWNGRDGFEYYGAPAEQTVARKDWFDQVGARYHWYDKSFGDVSHFNALDWFPAESNSPQFYGFAAFQRDDRLPSRLPPSQRVWMSVNAGAPNGDCAAAWQFTQATALSCITSVGIANAIEVPEPPSSLRSTGDLVSLERWMRTMTKRAREKLGQVFLENVPAPAVASFVEQRVSENGLKGKVGENVDHLTSAMGDLPKQWGDLLLQGETLTNAIAQTRLAIERADIDKATDEVNLAIRGLEAAKDAVTHVGGIFRNLADRPGSPASVGAASSDAAAIVIDGIIIAEIVALSDKTDQRHTNEINLSFRNLNQKLIEVNRLINNDLVSVRQDVANLRAATLEIQSQRNAVAYEAGKAAGLGVWNCGTPGEPQECKSTVNTVLNRRYAAFERRYQVALRDAKALAYIARRAIEQRFGIPLAQITTRVGPLDAPASWADDVCRLTGINYKRLQATPSLGAVSTTQRNAIDAAVASEFADSFVGDYVEKLANFVEYYNVAYPSKDGDDTVVMSLRENVLREGAACHEAGRNLLVGSSRLDEIVSVTPGTSSAGWHRHACDASSPMCLSVLSGASLKAPISPPSDGGVGGVSWLVNTPRPTGPGTGGVASTVDTVNIGAAPGPSGLMSQSVSLVPGRYILSWWAQARDLDGALTASPIGPYVVTVLDDSGNSLVTRTDAPAVGTAAAPWAARAASTFDVATPGTYRVAFGAALSGSVPGSVAIADVQLEAVGAQASPSSYQSTDANGKIDSIACVLSPAGFRSLFRRACDSPADCYYELSTPVEIDTRAFTANGISLVGKLAQGNFNYRHIDFAVNLVGTGIRDCGASSSPDCYGSGFVEYSLEHDGTDVGVLAYDGQAREFDFGVASIQHGKALTAERYITLPIASADQVLLNQAGIMKPELRGRPIDGTYRLRIHESAALQWNRLEDIQLVMKSRYWSHIATPGQF